MLRLSNINFYCTTIVQYSVVHLLGYFINCVSTKLILTTGYNYNDTECRVVEILSNISVLCVYFLACK